MSFLAASSVPTPLYATYARAFHFSPITTTVVFAAYAIAVLVALLILGRVSDHLGHRPVLLVALAVQIGAAVVLATAGGVDALLVGRALQGIATGAALGALGAAILDADPVRGALANSAVPGIGTGLGSLVSGMLVQYVPAPTQVVYLVLVVVFIAQGIGVAVSAETGSRKPGLRAALVPKLAVPRGIRGPVLAAAPILFAVWALSGLYGSLGPALARQLTGSASALLGGLPFSVLAIISSLTAIALSRVSPRAVMLCGITGTVVAAASALAAVELSSPAGFFASIVLAGIGFGAGLQGAFRTVMPQTAPQDRAGVLSILYIVSYCGMGIPAIIAGVLVVNGGGLISSARDYALCLISLAVVALVGLLLTTRSHYQRKDTPPVA
ncbi:MFS transporter [Subtercola sp. RTI3]|uniref:MFS transporter n=1 Tax=Subtercola sp. RTI3 TaxID=3048639 RepID=UPI002B22AA9F|nr:MFS transporter [Subtercola sp. RTI3]MEA9985764.1 MFS transporter [Subtercola sp. RTI3]